MLHVSTGDLLRAEIAANSDLGRSVKGTMDAGGYVADNIVIGLVNQKLGTEDARKNGWILDGFPRTEAQAKALNQLGLHPDNVVVLDVPDDVLHERITKRRVDPKTKKVYHLTYNPPPPGVVVDQRSDDTSEKFGIRLKEYYKTVDLVLGVYKSKVLIHRINGNQKADVVFAEIDKIIRS